jgi:hypothetical protein
MEPPRLMSATEVSAPVWAHTRVLIMLQGACVDPPVREDGCCTVSDDSPSALPNRLKSIIQRWPSCISMTRFLHHYLEYVRSLMREGAMVVDETDNLTNLDETVRLDEIDNPDKFDEANNLNDGGRPDSHGQLRAGSLFERPSRGRIGRLIEWATAATAVAAFALSLVTYVQLNSTPKLQVLLPPAIRLANDPGGVQFYIQPSLATNRKSDVPAIVTSVEVSFRGPTSSPEMYWCCIGEYTGDFVQEAQEKSRWALRWRQTSQAAPIIVAADKPQSPYLQYVGYDTPPFTAGRWNAVMAVAVAGQKTVNYEFCIDISVAAAGPLSSGMGTVPFRRNLPGDTSGCYALAYQ